MDTAQFDRAAALLPEKLRAEALFLVPALKAGAEELRLYGGRGFRVVLGDGSLSLRGEVTRADLEEVV